MIYDCFTFFNELELLDIRLHELNDVVDKFVLVEGTVTFTNVKKKLYFEENKHLFKEFNNKIIHVVVKDSPNSSNPWEIERFQFNAISRGLKNAKPQHTILLSCVDEIPKALEGKRWAARSPKKTKVFLQQLFYYYLNYGRADKNFWKGTKMLRKNMIPLYKDLYEIREKDADISIPNSGWHFSYIGGIKRIQQKLKAFSHTEYSGRSFTNKQSISNAITSKTSIFKDFIIFKTVDTNNLPMYVQNNHDKFKNFMSGTSPSVIEEISIALKKIVYKLKKNEK